MRRCQSVPPLGKRLDPDELRALALKPINIERLAIEAGAAHKAKEDTDDGGLAANIAGAGPDGAWVKLARDGKKLDASEERRSLDHAKKILVEAMMGAKRAEVRGSGASDETALGLMAALAPVVGVDVHGIDRLDGSPDGNLRAIFQHRRATMSERAAIGQASSGWRWWPHFLGGWRRLARGRRFGSVRAVFRMLSRFEIIWPNVILGPSWSEGGVGPPSSLG